MDLMRDLTELRGGDSSDVDISYWSKDVKILLEHFWDGYTSLRFWVKIKKKYFLLEEGEAYGILYAQRCLEREKNKGE